MRNLARCFYFLLLGAAVSPAWGQEEKNYDTPYYPLKVGSRWTYRSAGQRVVVEVEKSEPFELQHKDPAGGKAITERAMSYYLRLSSADKSTTEQVVVLADGVYRLSSAGKKLTPPLCFLKLPLNKNETWKVESESEGAKIRGTFVGGDEAVKVKAGDFQTMTVSSRDFQFGPRTLAVSYWFAPRVGLVKMTVRLGDDQTPRPRDRDDAQLTILELEDYKLAP